MEDGLRSFLLADPAVMDVISFASTIMKGSNQMLNYGFPKYFGAADSIAMAGTVWQLYLGGSAPGEMQQFFTSASTREGCIRVLLRDHTSATLTGLRARVEEFVEQRVKGDPELAQVHINYLGGSAGLYAAANDVLYQLDILNITFVLGVVFLFCVATFRSAVAGVLFVLSCVLANFGAFIYLRLRDAGLTIDTIPVISLGIGLGVDYGIYVVSRIRDEMRGGALLEDAIFTAITTTGVAVLSTFAVMVGGIVLWSLSPLRFHSEMSVLPVLLMFTNLVSGVLVLPCYIAWARPRFICRAESAAHRAVTPLTAAAS
jgi:predicted RND superfamily exporter protein